MDIKVIKGIVTFDGAKYEIGEVISGVDKPTANYLLSMNVVEQVDIQTNAPGEEATGTTKKPSKKSKQEDGPQTSL